MPRGLWTFINGRFVRDRMLQHAVVEAFRKAQFFEGYPAGIVSLRVNPSMFDVNVHPQKTEVRFANSQDIYRTVRDAMHEFFADAQWLKNRPSRVQQATHAFLNNASRDERKDLLASDGYSQLSPDRTAAYKQQTSRAHHVLENSLEAFGVAWRSHLIAADHDYLWVIDVRQAARCCAVAQLNAMVDTDSVKTQSLLFPESFAVGSEEESLLLEQLQIWSSLGVEIVQVAPGRFVITSMPDVAERWEWDGFKDILLRDEELTREMRIDGLCSLAREHVPSEPDACQRYAQETLLKLFSLEIDLESTGIARTSPAFSSHPIIDCRNWANSLRTSGFASACKFFGVRPCRVCSTASSTFLPLRV